MKYTIKFDDCSNLWIMNDKASRTVSEHLYYIAKQHGIGTLVYSESQLLFILRECGLEIELLEEDGSQVTW